MRVAVPLLLLGRDLGVVASVSRIWLRDAPFSPAVGKVGTNPLVPASTLSLDGDLPVLLAEFLRRADLASERLSRISNGRGAICPEAMGLSRFHRDQRKGTRYQKSGGFSFAPSCDIHAYPLLALVQSEPIKAASPLGGKTFTRRLAGCYLDPAGLAPLRSPGSWAIVWGYAA